MKRLVSVILSVGIMLTSLPVFAQPSGDTLKEKAEQIASTLVSQYGATSVQYAMIEDGEIVLSGSKGVYDKAENKAIESYNMYGVGSISKTYTAAAVMKLVDEGKVDIDKPLTTYLKDFKMADERYKQITPRMLLNHSSGIYGTHFKNAFLFNDNDTIAHDDLLKNLEVQILKQAPGEASEYCNDGFALLEILVERVSGIGFTEFIDKNFSQPLQLENTKTPLDEFDKEKLAKVYMPMYDKALPLDTINVIGTGGIYSTAEEVCKFAQIVMGEKPEILSEKSALAMQSEEYKNGIWVNDGGENIFSYGLGWDTVSGFPLSNYGIKALFKGGDTMLYHSAIVAIPEHNIAMAVMSSGGTSIYNYAFASSILAEALKEKGVIDEIKPERKFELPVKAEMPKEMEKYSGAYANAGVIINLEVKDGQLTIPPLLGGMVPAQTLTYVGNGEFKNNDGNATASFSEEKNGKTYLNIKTYLTLPGVGQVAWAYFDSQKLVPNAIDENIASVWNERNNDTYYIVDDKATSQIYFIPSLSPSKLTVDTENGYAFGGSKIVDENNAVNVLRFREATDLKFFKENDAEYLKARGYTFINSENIPTIFGGERSICTIQQNGFVRYCKVGETSVGKTMKVKIPEGAAFAVYDENNICVNFTTVSGNDTTVLPANGMIAFIGNIGDVFEITLN